MAVKQYVEIEKPLWMVNLNIRSRTNPSLRLQVKRGGFETEKAALQEEKKLLRELTEKLALLEAKGASWAAVVDKWEAQQKLFPTKKYSAATIMDHAALLRNWTKEWLEKPASEINRGDGREVIRKAKTIHGKSAPFLRKLKHTVNVIYNWGIEERMICGVHDSPVFGIEIEDDGEDKMPEILNRDQVKKLLLVAREVNHAWYPVWTVVVLTGLRSGEAHALRRTDVEMVSREEAERLDKLPAHQPRNYGFIRVTKTWSARTRSEGPTKGRRWRTVPISKGLYWFLAEYMVKADNGEYLLPRSWKWDQGSQAEVLREFCEGHGLPSIKFHTLRACFATHLIADGVPISKVMKIGGWADIETMEIYNRMAGVDEAGATETLDFIPSDDDVMGRVVNMYEFQSQRGQV